MVRKQFHFRPSKRGYFAWDIGRLINLSRDLPMRDINLSEIAELQETYWYSDATPTVQSVAEHAQLIHSADLSFPIILSANGRVMDGMHRVAKAFTLGHETIRAIRFDCDPEPDFVDVFPDELDYSTNP